MALEAVVYPQDPFGYGGKDLYNLLAGGANWAHDNFNLAKEEEEHGSISTFLENQTENYPYGDWNFSPPSMLPHFNELHLSNPNSSETTNASNQTPSEPQNYLDSSVNSISARPKRRRAKTRKNKEEIENQRMTHIAVERNRRKQMNEYLSVLRSLMPDSYVQRVLISFSKSKKGCQRSYLFSVL